MNANDIVDDQCEATGTYRFDELGEKAKEYARRKFRDSEGYLAYDWWDSTYDDFVKVAELLGVEIECGVNGRNIFFTLHGQGAGAAFDGRYAYRPNATARIQQHAPEDKELHRIAEGLTLAQTSARMLYGDTFIVGIQVRGRGTHAESMRLGWRMGDGAANSDIDGAHEQMDAIHKLIKDLAKWLYKQLEAEWDYLMSDQVIDGYLREMVFTDEGEEVA